MVVKCWRKDTKLASDGSGSKCWIIQVLLIWFWKVHFYCIFLHTFEDCETWKNIQQLDRSGLSTGFRVLEPITNEDVVLVMQFHMHQNKFAEKKSLTYLYLVIYCEDFKPIVVNGSKQFSNFWNRLYVHFIGCACKVWISPLFEKFL